MFGPDYSYDYWLVPKSPNTTAQGDKLTPVLCEEELYWDFSVSKLWLINVCIRPIIYSVKSMSTCIPCKLFYKVYSIQMTKELAITTIKIKPSMRRKLKVIAARSDTSISDVVESLMVGLKDTKIIKKHN